MIRYLYRILWSILILFIFTQSCSNSPRYNRHKPKPQKYKSNSKIQKSQKVFYGMSSYYGQDFHGKLTANGEIFDMYGVTAAHKEFPFNTVVRVTNEKNGKSLLIRINDRGPYIAGRILDCSFGAAKKLGFVGEGTAKVKIEVLEWGDGEYMHHD